MATKARGFLAALFAALPVAAAVCAQSTLRVRWDDVLRQPAGWYGTQEAKKIADNVLRYQRADGGWPKDIDMAVVPAGATPTRPDSTIDNGATTTQIRLLARIGDPPYRAGALRGVDYVLAAQYPNGGWPQFFPLRSDYSRYITFNDDAMVNVLFLLDDVARGKTPFDFLDNTYRQRAATAIASAIRVIQRCQVVVNGTPTAWAAQHDEVALEPRAARAFEPVALASAESVGVVRFLMQGPKTTETTRAIEAAVAWLKSVQLPDGRWARFYEIGTNRAIFAGRDGIVRYSVQEIEKERQDGYAWYGTWPRDLLAKAYPAWKSRQ